LAGSNLFEWKYENLFNIVRDVTMLAELAILVNDALVFKERNWMWNDEMLFECIPILVPNRSDSV
jgi:hypothetical protein